MRSLINQEFTFAIAPMMDWSDRHYRSFMRLITRRAVLYSEMVTAAAVVHGDRQRLLGFSPLEHPVVLQLGGADPQQLAEAARIGEGFGYQQINLNVGCPSDRVQSGRFGAALMLEPEIVANCVLAMQAAVSVPVTVKCRIGVDAQNVQQTLPNFLQIVADAGCQTFIIHARKAWLKGLSPKQNRDVPPLEYPLVVEMKRQFSQLQIILNGGLLTLEQALAQSANLDGAMIGRAAYHNPWQWVQVDQQVFAEPTPPATREQVVQGLIEYAALEQGDGTRLHDITRHVLGLFAGEPGARQWRRILSEDGVKPGADWRVIARAAAEVLPKMSVA
ncbi:tRNA-dihydrouridine(20/20a) synthase [hydrothermal vent metagenome]|uniref:tRNA-dihydrouridine(20/20a) synthase n=1 Tax=hydrothermal vent metagenome TaxID=652676 RepID=A0A3B0R3M1_9ZZZZ